MKYALITGASSGIGKEFAFVFARERYDLILVARRQAQLEDISIQIREKHKVDVQVIVMDLALEDAGRILFESIAPLNDSIEVLINNAGFADYSLFDSSDWSKQKRMMHLNIVTLTELCRRYAPLMAAKKRGHILNVASTAAFMAGPRMSVYFASKAFVVSFSEALSEELRPKGVSVTVLCPGATKSEFQKTAGMEKSWLARKIPRKSSRSVAEFGYAAMKKKKVVAIHGGLNWFMTICIKFIPRNFITWMTRKSLE